MGFSMFQEWMFGNSVQLSEDSLQKDFCVQTNERKWIMEKKEKEELLKM